jgi:pantoate--beta-alanine ligase
VTDPVPLVHTVSDMRARIALWRARGDGVALVPTMGALHAGHASLVEEARKYAPRVVVTVFVNPKQFAAGEDFGKYPRTLPGDLERLASVAADLCFAPSVEDMYPDGFATNVSMTGPAKVDLEDRFRPTHFDGVATVVTKLLNQAQADVAVFGEKDYQQLLVIRRLARDLDIATEIRAAPTLRESDGLALSSRNVYLSPEERAAAPAIHRALTRAAERIRSGEEIGHAMAEGYETLVGAGFALDYFEARHAETLARIVTLQDGPVRLLAAAKLGATRLIDNIAV